MKGKHWIILGLLVTLIVLAGCAPAAAPKPAPAPSPAPSPAPAPPPPPATKPPASKLMSVAIASEVGSIAYAGTVAVGDGLKRTVGIDLKVSSIPGDIALLSALKDGTVQFIMPGSATTQTAFVALGKFAEAKWPPMKELRQIWTMYWTDVGLGVKANSDIKTLYDLKGKRMAVVPTSDAYTLAAKSLCAWIQADYDKDFKQVVSPSYSGAIEYVKNGHADFAFSGTSASTAYETAAAPGGLRWIPMSPSDTAGYDRWFKAWPVPGYGAVFVPQGKGAAIPPEGYWGFGSPYTFVGLQDKLDVETAYTLAKGFTMGYQYYWEKTATLWQCNLPSNASLDFTLQRIPFHEGQVKWLTEMGCWTPALAAQQAKRLKDIGATK